MTTTQMQRQARREAVFRQEDSRCVICRRKGWDRDGAGPTHDDEVCPLDVHYVRLRDTGRVINAETVLCDYCRGCAEEYQLRRNAFLNAYSPMAILSRMSPPVVPAVAKVSVPDGVRQARAAYRAALAAYHEADASHREVCGRDLATSEEFEANDRRLKTLRAKNDCRAAYDLACRRWVDSLLEGD